MLVVFLLLSVTTTTEFRGGVGAWMPSSSLGFSPESTRRIHRHQHLTTSDIGKKTSQPQQQQPQQRQNENFLLHMLSPKVADGMPRMSQKGIYQIQTEEDYT